MQLGRGETIADTARVLSRYVDAIMIRILNHEKLLSWRARHRAGDQRADAALASLPGDGRRDDLRGASRPDRGPSTVAWTGDDNNVLASWVHAAERFEFRSTSRRRRSSRRTRRCGLDQGDRRADRARHDPEAAVRGADCVVTDTWVSMGDKDGEHRHNCSSPIRSTPS
jgi:ornithine carbamoyltransferase